MSLSKLLTVLKGGPPSDDGGVGSGNYTHKKTAQPYLQFDTDTPRTASNKAYHRLRDPWMETLDPEHKRSIKHYSQEGYKVINNVLRFGKPYATDGANPATESAVKIHRETAHEHIKNMYASMQPISRNVVVYRGGKTDTSELPVGTIFRDRGFVSTALVARTAQYRGLMMSSIKIPKGTKVSYGMHSVLENGVPSDNSEEQEIILPPNSSFKVAGVTLDDRYGYITNLELIPTKKSYKPTVVREGPHDALK